MAKLHDILTDYLRMANGWFPVSWGYTDEFLESEVRAGEPCIFYSAWDDHARDLERVLTARGMTRRQFMRKGTAPAPSYIANLVICSELRKIHGDISGLDGFDDKGNFILPRRTFGLLCPLKDITGIYQIEYYAFSTLFKPKVAAHAAS